MLHVTKGTPWGTPEQGKARTQTQWEQIDCGQQFTPTKKFLTVVPVVMLARFLLFLCGLKTSFLWGNLKSMKVQILQINLSSAFDGWTTKIL